MLNEYLASLERHRVVALHVSAKSPIKYPPSVYLFAKQERSQLSGKFRKVQARKIEAVMTVYASM